MNLTLTYSGAIHDVIELLIRGELWVGEKGMTTYKISLFGKPTRMLVCFENAPITVSVLNTIRNKITGLLGWISCEQLLSGAQFYASIYREQTLDDVLLTNQPCRYARINITCSGTYVTDMRLS